MSNVQPADGRLKQFKSDIFKMAPFVQQVMPMGDARAFLSQVYLYVQQSPKLLNAAPNSMANAILICAQMGLAPNSAQQLVHIVPFKGKATVIPGYRGYIELMTRAGHIVDIDPQIVRHGDEFDFGLGTKPYIHHKPRWAKPEHLESGQHIDDVLAPCVAAYAVATFKDGHKKFEVMPIELIHQSRDGSRGYDPHDDGCTWIKHYEAMVRKTPVRMLSKYVPQSLALAMALDADVKHDSGEEQRAPIDPAADIETTATTATKASNLEDEIKGGPNYAVLGKRILEARLTAKMDIEEACGLLGIKDAELADVEGGDAYKPNDGKVVDRLNRFAVACEIDPATLIDVAL